ncbi:MAG: PRC-barrel domain-containing protein [Pseudomonadota bacterium]
MVRIAVFVAAIAFGTVAAGAENAAPIIGETVLGVEVNVAKVVSKGYSAKRLIGAAVHNTSAENIGTVYDLIVGVQGEVSLAIVEVGGFLGLGSKRVAVPAHMFVPGPAKDVILAGATEAALNAMPAFLYKN